MKQAFALLLCGAAVIAMAVAALTETAHSQGKVEIDSVAIRLFLATSGELSPDVETIQGFGAWNSAVQGEGIGKNERFYAAVIIVRLTAQGEVYAKGTQVQIVVTDRRTRRIVKRERIADPYVGAQGMTHVLVFLPNADCGPFDVVVTGGGRKIVKALEAGLRE